MNSDVVASVLPATLVIPILVQVVKRCGLPSKLAPVAAVGFGVAYTLFAYLVRLFPGLQGIGEALGAGLTLGLSSCGLYSSFKAMAGRSPLGRGARTRGHVTRDVPALGDGSVQPAGKVAGHG